MKRLLLTLIVVSLTAGCQSQARQPLFGGGGAGGLGGFAGNLPSLQNGGMFSNNQQGQGGLSGLFGGNAAGTGNNPFGNVGFGNAGIGTGNGPGAQFAGQVGNLTNQLTQFNSDNENLHAQVATLQQRLQNSNSYNDQLKQQLGDQIAQLQQTQNQLQMVSTQSQQQIAAAQAQARQSTNSASNQFQGQLASTNGGGDNGPPTRFAGATIRANNGLMQKLQTVQLPGFKSWMDGDVIRIQGPTDRLFVSGTYQINPNDAMTMANLANAIRQNFPRQAIGVEAHWDGSAIQPASTSHHQLTATQALAVFDLLVKSGLPHNQVFVMGVGSNRPRFAQRDPANRRIEIVIYPETF